MFTGSGPQEDILRAARAKEKAQTAPMTFVGRRNTQSMVREIDDRLDAVLQEDAKAGEGNMQRWLETSFQVVESQRQELSDQGRYNDDDHHDNRASKQCITCLALIIQTAIRKKVSQSQVLSDLELLGFRGDTRTRIAEYVHQSHMNKMCHQSAPKRRLENFKWRINLIVASDKNAEQALEPEIMFQLLLDDGSIRTFTISAEQFQQLRYSTAKMLLDMTEVERHPMIRIVEELLRTKVEKQAKQAS